MGAFKQRVAQKVAPTKKKEEIRISNMTHVHTQEEEEQHFHFLGLYLSTPSGSS